MPPTSTRSMPQLDSPHVVRPMRHRTEGVPAGCAGPSTSPPRPGRRGQRGATLYFARSLADALERLGQASPSTPATPATARPATTTTSCSCCAASTGRARAGPAQPEWVISHPDLVTAEEMAGLRPRLRRQRSWAHPGSAATGASHVGPLLQCTDPRYFHPDRGCPTPGPAVLFVGNSAASHRTPSARRWRSRPTSTVHGADWDEYLDPQMVASSGVRQRRGRRALRLGGVVLNDHHVDMRRDWFLSNRLFDAAACGARIVTDEVSGPEEIFGALVQPFDDEHDLARLVRPPYAAFPDNETRRELARADRRRAHLRPAGRDARRGRGHASWRAGRQR